MLSYHVDLNVTMVEPFQSRHDRHNLAAENRIMSRLQKNGHNVDLQILDKKCSTAYKLQIEEKWKSTFQLIPPVMYCHNAAERMIQTSKVHFLSILARVSGTFTNFLWEKLLPQTELTLNLPIKHCPCHIHLLALQRPLQIQLHSISSPWQTKHHT